MEPFSSLAMSIIGAFVLVMLGFAFVGALFLLGSCSWLCMEFLILTAKRIYRRGHYLIAELGKI